MSTNFTDRIKNFVPGDLGAHLLGLKSLLLVVLEKRNKVKRSLIS